MSKLMTIGETSSYLSIPVKTLRHWVYRREIPFVKLGRNLRFKLDDIEAWINNHRIDHASRNETEKEWKASSRTYFYPREASLFSVL